MDGVSIGYNISLAWLIYTVLKVYVVELTALGSPVLGQVTGLQGVYWKVYLLSSPPST